MLSAYSTVGIPARRYRGGVCRGTLTLKQHPKTKTNTSSSTSATLSSTFIYAVSIASTFRIYESFAAYERGDVPLYYCTIVGSSAASTSTSRDDTTTLRMVTNQGTHLEASAPTRTCATTWMQALSAGLSLSIMQHDTNTTATASFSNTTIGVPQLQPPAPPTPRNNRRKGLFGKGGGGGAAVTPPYCRCCGSSTASTVASLSPVPLPQYGAESRVDVCTNCRTSQGLWHVLHDTVMLQQAAHSEDEACREAYRLAMEATTATSTTTTTTTTTTSQSNNSSGDESASSPPSSTTSSSELSQTKWVAIDDDTDDDVNAALTRCLTSTAVAPLRTTSCVVDRLCAAFLIHGTMGAAECLEQLAEYSSSSADSATADSAGGEQQQQHTSMRRQAAALKTQAFREAGSDMGTAMQLFVEHALMGDDSTTHQGMACSSADAAAADASTSTAAQGGNNDPHHHNSTDDTTTSTQLLSAVLDFFLDVCENNDVSAVAFFWPQVCHVHLRMLPATTAPAVARVQRVEQFLITVATKYSIHLALQLVWSHTADLEESMAVSVAAATAHQQKSSTSGGASASSGSAAAAASASDDEVVSAACRKRRFAVLRFVCELESVLFDFNGGWGGGSVAVGKFLQPTAAHGALLEKTAAQLVQLRQEHNHVALIATDTSTPAARLRIAQHADYFSCTLNFSRRLAEIAEKLRFAEVAERATLLEQELNILNASGAMGGDPLNRLAASGCLTRVARVPSQEGHVFRSKERTPVLLLMEVMTDTDGTESSESPPKVAEQAQGEPEAPEEESSPVKNDLPAGPTESAEFETRADSAIEDGGNPQSAASEDVSEEKESHHGALDVQPSGTSKEAVEVDMDATDSTPTPVTTLVGADEGGFPLSPGHNALIRFDNDGEMLEGTSSATPKKDVVKIVNSVATEHLREINLPDISQTPENRKGEKRTDVPESIATRDQADVEIVATSFSDGDNTNLASDAALAIVDTEAQSDAPTEAITAETKPTPAVEPLNDIYSPKLAATNRLGMSRSGSGDVGDSTHSLAPTGDIRRAVLTTIMMRGLQGNTIAAGAADSVQRSLKELERKRATELLLSDGCQDDSVTESVHDTFSEHADESTTNQKIASLGLNTNLEEAELASRTSEEDEVMEAIRLMLIQNRVAQGQLSAADAAKVLQHTSLNPINASKESRSIDSPPSIDESECPTIDAGDVDPRLVGCGALPPAVLQALTLWKGGVVSHAELLELVKKDIEFVKHSVLVDAENLNMLKENSAFWARFAFGERWAEKKARIGSTSPQGTAPGWDMMGVIVKSNDDLRQEAFVMQLIELSKEAFDLAGLELWVGPYRILATGRTTGVIECVRNAMSFDALKKRPGYGRGGLREHLQRMTEFTADPGEAFKSAQRNFVRSLAAYSLISYLFLIKDRHNGNLLLDTAGHVIHIDFGFVFGIAPGGSFSLEMSTPFKLTEEMLDVMGGLRSPLFSEFVTLFCCGFLALQSHSDTFLTLVEITCKQSTFKCFDGRDTKDIVAKMRERFCPDMSKEDTVSFALDLIKQATTSYGTKQYDLFQYISQGIVA